MGGGGGGGGRGTPRNFWFGCAVWFFKTWPVFQTKYVIFGYLSSVLVSRIHICFCKSHTRFQTFRRKRLKSILYSDQNCHTLASLLPPELKADTDNKISKYSLKYFLSKPYLNHAPGSLIVDFSSRLTENSIRQLCK